MSTSTRVAAIDRRLDEPLGDCSRGDGIGIVGPDIPIEVLLSTGRPFGHLPWRADGITDWTDQWLESSFHFWARSILQQWHEGAFDGLDTVIFSRGGDASQRLYYYVAELQARGKLAGPTPVMFDIALIPRESSLEHSAAAVVELMRVLEVSTAELPDGIAKANRLRLQTASIENNRVGDGVFYERLGRAALWSDPTQWLDELEFAATDPSASRILLAGSVPPDERVHQAVDASGASIIAEAHALAPGRLGGELELTDEPVERALARHLRRSSLAPRAFHDRATHIVEKARSVKADAVVLWLTREDEALAWTAPSELRALREAGLPTLMLPAARWQADDGALERITLFCEEQARATA